MSSALPILIPHETVNDESVRLLAWMVESGKPVEKEQLLGEVETSKAILEIHSPEAGFVWYTHQVGDDVSVGAPLCFVTQSAAESPFIAPPAPAPILEKAAEDDLPPARFTPLAARMAKELNLDIHSFPKGTLVRRQDIQARIDPPPPVPQAAPRTAPPPPQAAPPQQPLAVAGVPVRWESLPKRKIAEGRLLAAGNAAAVPSLVTVSCHTGGLRKKLALGRPAGPSASALIVFETARLLRKYPAFNAVYANGKGGFYEEVNIGYAIDGGEGLVVPVIRNAAEKSLWDIHHEMKRYVDAYVQNRLQAADLSGATFTVSDLSGEGVASFTPIISRGQAAILGVGTEIFPRGSASGAFTLTLAFDHQLAEGRSSAQFLTELSGRIEAYEDSLQAPAAAERPQDRFCTFCSRPPAELKRMNAYLLQSIMPEGLICSICLAEY